MQLKGALARAETNVKKQLEQKQQSAVQHPAGAVQHEPAAVQQLQQAEPQQAQNKPRASAPKSSRLFGGAERDAEAAGKAYEKASELLEQGQYCESVYVCVCLHVCIRVCTCVRICKAWYWLGIAELRQLELQQLELRQLGNC